MKTFNLNEAAAFLHLHPHTLEAKARAGEIPGAKPGKCWVFIDDDLADWLRAQYKSAKPVEEEFQSIGVIRPFFSKDAKAAARELGKLLQKPITKKPRP